MSADLIDAFDGIVTLELTGALSPRDLAAVHSAAAIHLREWQGGKLLILAGNFTGWTKEGDWADLPFQTANDELIHKMAIVGDTRWEDFARLFTSERHRPFPIEFFPTGQDSEARAWLKS